MAEEKKEETKQEEPKKEETKQDDNKEGSEGEKKKKEGLITTPMRKAIKKIAQISQCAKALSLMPTPEDFALRLIGDMRIIAKLMKSISTRIDEILERYTNIPTEFLLKGFDEILEKLHDIDDYAKFAISETMNVMSSTVKSAKEISDSLGSAVSAATSATLQIGGGLTYGAIAMGANIKLAMEDNGSRSITNGVIQDTIDGKVSLSEMNEELSDRIEDSVGSIDAAADAVRDWTKNATENATESIDNFFDGVGEGISDAVEWIDGVKKSADGIVDDTVGALIEKVENAKRDIEEKIERVKKIFENFTKNFDDAFGFVNGKNFAEDTFRDISETAKEMGSDSKVLKELGNVSNEAANFIKNFNIGKVITAMGGLVVGAGAATLAMDLLPSIDVDKMLKNIIGGINTKNYPEDKLRELNHNKYYEDGIELLEVPGCPWQLSKDDLEKYNPDGYNKYLEDFEDENNKIRSEILEQMQKVKTSADLAAVTKANREKMKQNKSALKAMRKVRRDAIKARMIDRYKGFLRVEIDYLKKECNDMKNDIKKEWDTMMSQYTLAINEITKFFTTDGSGGNDKIDKCCDRINEDAEKIVELCKSITTELTNAVAMVPTPYSIGTCVDMPVHKILAYFKDIQIIITFLKNLIRLGIDIISQLSILVKIICEGLKNLKEVMEQLKKLIGVDSILKIIDFLIALFRSKMVDGKLLMENAISPIYYNETEEYEEKINAIEALLEDDDDGGVTIDEFKYTDDPYARKKYRKKVFGGKMASDEDIEDALEELEAKGEREIVAYRSPLLNAEGDDFAGWIYYYSNAYDDMKKTWSSGKKRRRNKLIRKASKKNKLRGGRLVGGVAQLKNNKKFGYYNERGNYVKNSVTGFDAYYWYTKWTNDPTECEPDFSNTEPVYDKDGNIIGNRAINANVVSPVHTTSNGSLVELSDGRRVFVEGKVVKSGDFVNVDGVKYRVK